MYSFSLAYPSPQHEAAARAVTALFSADAAVEAVLLMGSTARGKASPDSCLDILILHRPDLPPAERERLESLWSANYPSAPVYAEMLAVGAFSHVDLEFIDGVYDPAQHHHGWTSGADAFELEVGNHLAYSTALWEADPRGGYYQQLRQRWLPYYPEALRSERLAMVRRYCRNNLAHIPLFARRGLHFQAFKRLYTAFEEFLQALFISRRTYPIAYDKWVREGVVDILGLPELYERLPRLLEIGQFESLEIIEKARELEALLDRYTSDAKTRFSSRVENYEKYRPSYPARVIDTLREQCGLSPVSVIADIGSGTGLLARLFLDYGCEVFGVEPNAEMRAAGERQLAGYPRFTSVGGSAEATGLPSGSVDFITAGQAFHWFDTQAARPEFLRILRPGGWVALVWNHRRVDATPFLRDYEALLQQYNTDYNQVNHRNVEEDPLAIPQFFGGAYQKVLFDYTQHLDYPALEGRLLSSSYTPEPGHHNHAPMLAELRRIFDRHQQGGRVAFDYDTHVYFGRLVIGD